ncbi:MAG: hypothetical protein DDG60_09635 [Anaerolineae bacterium]|nr:MAG: hypothetical protein DDG60_09635 [Anaerolineae bacterium]
MKKFLKFVLLPLLVLSAVVALFGAGWWWGATHTQAFSSLSRSESGEFRRPDFDGNRLPPQSWEGRPFGGRERGPSLLRGLGGVFGALLKLAVIVVLVLLVQRGLAWFDTWRASRKTPPAVPPEEQSANP